MCGLLVVCSLCSASASEPQQSSITLVRDVLVASYPELLGGQHELHVHIEGPLDYSWRKISGFHFEVKLYNAHLEKYLNPPHDAKTGKRFPVPENRTLLQGTAYFPEGDTRLKDVSFVGEAAKTPENDSMHRLVQSHPEWSDAEANQALKQAGARYGTEDKQEFLKRLPLKQLEPVLGKLTLVSANFHVFNNPEHLGDPSLEWWVNVSVLLPDGTRGSYALFFEPFEGKLIEILRPRSSE